MAQCTAHDSSDLGLSIGSAIRNGWKAVGNEATIALAVVALAKAAAKHHVGSEFAAWWRGR